MEVSIIISNAITKEQHRILKELLEQLIDVILIMRREKDEFLLKMNEDEAVEWLFFLDNHYCKNELKSLENEIANRLFYKFDVSIRESDLDYKRVNLMRKYILISNEYLKKCD